VKSPRAAPIALRLPVLFGGRHKGRRCGSGIRLVLPGHHCWGGESEDRAPLVPEQPRRRAGQQQEEAGSSRSSQREPPMGARRRSRRHCGFFSVSCRGWSGFVRCQMSPLLSAPAAVVLSREFELAPRHHSHPTNDARAVMFRFFETSQWQLARPAERNSASRELSGGQAPARAAPRSETPRARPLSRVYQWRRRSYHPPKCDHSAGVINDEMLS
jgi:hypothetical protein